MPGGKSFAPSNRLADFLDAELAAGSAPGAATDPFLTAGTVGSAGKILPTLPQKPSKRRRKRATIRFSLPTIEPALRAKIAFAGVGLLVVMGIVVFCNCELAGPSAPLVGLAGLAMIVVGRLWFADMALREDVMTIKFWLILSLYLGLAMVFASDFLSAICDGTM